MTALEGSDSPLDIIYVYINYIYSSDSPSILYIHTYIYIYIYIYIYEITAYHDCSNEIKRYLLLERRAITNLNSILKNRAITLPTKLLFVNTMVFPVVTYGCESWTTKAECRRIDAFECGVGEDC